MPRHAPRRPRARTGTGGGRPDQQNLDIVNPLARVIFLHVSSEICHDDEPLWTRFACGHGERPGWRSYTAGAAPLPTSPTIWARSYPRSLACVRGNAARRSLSERSPTGWAYLCQTRSRSGIASVLRQNPPDLLRRRGLVHSTDHPHSQRPNLALGVVRRSTASSSARCSSARSFRIVACSSGEDTTSASLALAGSASGRARDPRAKRPAPSRAGPRSVGRGRVFRAQCLRRRSSAGLPARRAAPVTSPASSAVL